MYIVENWSNINLKPKSFHEIYFIHDTLTLFQTT